MLILISFIIAYSTENDLEDEIQTPSCDIDTVRADDAIINEPENEEKKGNLLFYNFNNHSIKIYLICMLPFRSYIFLQIWKIKTQKDEFKI